MKLMYDKENRRYLTLIGLFCLGLVVSCLAAGILQGPAVRNSLFEWEKTTASSLLEQGVDAGMIAEAFHSKEATAEGERLLSQIGPTRDNISCRRCLSGARYLFLKYVRKLMKTRRKKLKDMQKGTSVNGLLREERAGWTVYLEKWISLPPH